MAFFRQPAIRHYADAAFRFQHFPFAELALMPLIIFRRFRRQALIIHDSRPPSAFSCCMPFGYCQLFAHAIIARFIARLAR